MPSLRASVARGSFLLLSGEMIRLLVGLFSLAYFVRTLSLAEYGLVIAFDVALTFVRMISDPGLSSAIVTYCSHAMGERKNMAPLIRKLVLTGGLLAFIASLGVLLAGNYLSNLILQTYLTPNVIMLLSIDAFLTCLAKYGRSSMEAFKAFQSLTSLETGAYVTQRILGILFVSVGYGISGIVVGWILGDAAFLVRATTIIRRNLKAYSSFPVLTLANRQLARFAIPVYSTRFVNFVWSQFDQLLVLAIFPIEIFAIYGVADSIFSFVAGLPFSVSQTILPHFSEQYGKEGMSSLLSSIKEASRSATLLFTPIFLGVAAICIPVVSLMAGSSYADAAILLAILCIFDAFTLPDIGFNQIFYVLKRTEIQTLVEIAGGATGLALSLVLASPFGLVGIAAARGISFVAGYSIEVLGLRRIASIKLDRGTILRIIASAAIMAVVVFAAQQVYYQVAALGMYVLIGVVCYLAVLRGMRVFKKKDFDLARELLGARLAPAVDVMERFLLRSAKVNRNEPLKQVSPG
jgi:O-antigen/teichoic acid export membrane protein